MNNILRLLYKINIADRANNSQAISLICHCLVARDAFAAESGRTSCCALAIGNFASRILAEYFDILKLLRVILFSTFRAKQNIEPNKRWPL